jgi:integrase
MGWRLCLHSLPTGECGLSSSQRDACDAKLLGELAGAVAGDCTPQGTKWSSPASYFVKIRDRVAKANKDFRPFRFHDLRHLYAVEALRGGMGIYALSKHLGHTSVGITERVYLAFLTPEEAQAAKAKAA